MEGVLQAQSDKADDIVPLITQICYDHYCIGNWCALNEYGDRLPLPHDVWFYAPGAGKPSYSYIAGTYNTDTHTMS